MQCRELPVYNVCLGFPGTSFHFLAVSGVLEAASRNRIGVMLSGSPAGNFNKVWSDALNLFEAGQITHFAMLHSDIAPDQNWVDTIIDEMDRLKASLISVAVPIKDVRGVMSCGIADPEDQWNPLRRVTRNELLELPETFNAADFGYPGQCLLHNNGCWVADLRFKEFFTTDERGYLRAVFDFPTRIYRHGPAKIWGTDGESEDWFFSRQLHEIGLRNTYVTRKVKVLHIGQALFSNVLGKGTFQNGDEDLAEKWRKNGHSNGKGNNHASQIIEELEHGPGIGVPVASA